MKQVTRYQCEYCGKDFKTPNRHQCKYNPKYKNCFTCKHNKGFEEEVNDTGYGTSIFALCAITNAYEFPDEYYRDDDTTRADAVKGELMCNKHEYCGKWFENEHAKNKLGTIRKDKEIEW